MVNSEDGPKPDPPVQAGFLTHELTCKAAAFPGDPSGSSLKIRIWCHYPAVTPAAADFEYSKDWLVTDSHRLSFYHVNEYYYGVGNYVASTPPNCKLSHAPAGAVYTPL